MAGKGRGSRETNTRSSITGKYVKSDYGKKHPNTTEVERKKPRK